MRKILFYFFILFAVLASVNRVQANQAGKANETSSLLNVSLEDLMNMTVSTASKSDRALNETPSAVYVITAEDIRRSGLTSLPEILRLAPGVQVASMDANRWAISIRGHNDEFASKLLVLIDGREIYTPLFSGVFWDMHDYVTEDIDRIEVVRGPGATMWGSNAVNGVINIITKDSKNTQGTLLSAFTGGEESWIGSARYGGKLGDKGGYRVYVRSMNRPSRVLLDGTLGLDSLLQFHTGFRADLELSERDALTVHANYSNGDGGQYGYAMTYLPGIVRKYYPKDFSGKTVMANWSRKYNPSLEDSVSLYWDGCRRLDAIHRENRNTFDLDIQRKRKLGNKHDLLFGISARKIDTDIVGIGVASVAVPSTSNSIYSFYAQDQISLDSNGSSLLLVGSKFEHNSNTGLEIQPTFRYLNKVAENEAWWASVSRAARTPSDGERYGRIFRESLDLGFSLPVHIYLIGNPDFDSEHLTAYELGYRSQLNKDASVDAALFYNYYTNCKNLEFGNASIVPGDQPYVYQPIIFKNNGTVRTYGGEVSFAYIARQNWKVLASASYMNNNMTVKPGVNDTGTTTRVIEGNNPRWQFNLRSYINLSDNTELDIMLYYVSSIFTRAVSPSDRIPANIRCDIRLGRKFSNGSELVIGGRNLFNGGHHEYGAPRILITKVAPTFYAKYTMDF